MPRKRKTGTYLDQPLGGEAQPKVREGGDQSMPSNQQMSQKCKRQFKELEPAIRRVALEANGRRPVIVVNIDCPDLDPMTATTITWAKADKAFGKLIPAEVWAKFKRDAKRNPRMIPAGILKNFGDQFAGTFELVDPDGPVAEPGQLKLL
jgi:hypothetical protein